ncbi:MAG: metal-dependent hydrolase [Candidatus Helarchaeota archaeon]
MKWRYHAMVNFIVLAPIIYFTTPEPYGWVHDFWYLFAAAIAGFSGHLPDFDIILMKSKLCVHRDVFWHSFIIPVISPILYLIYPNEMLLYSIALVCIGYGTHLLCDFFPKMNLAGFGLIHVGNDAQSESWSLKWLTWGFIISVLVGAAIIAIILLF